MALKLAIIMNQNSYVGREYLMALEKNKISIDILSIGSFSEVCEIEKKRCGGLWQPTSMQELQKYFRIYEFRSLKDLNFFQFLDLKKYDLGIQGGTGILKSDVISRFGKGILNFHPGDLPKYRGSSAPEWQLIEKKAIVSTCHLVDEGIDTGPILAKKKLKCSKDNYHAFRASIYPLTAEFMIEVLSRLILNQKNEIVGEIQDESKAIYRKYIGDETIAKIIARFSSMIEQVE